MKILIDINHPAHVHYFRNFIKLMETKGHEFCVINRDSKMINQLLDYYEIKHIIRNKRPEKKGTVASLMNLTRMTIRCIRASFTFHPDMYMGFASSACAITSWLFRKPSILMDDTEHNVMNHRIYMPVCSVVLTPFYFSKELQKEENNQKQFRFDAYIEQLYLHSALYVNKKKVLDELNVKPKEYVLVRYIAYDAHHDIVAQPLSEEAKKQIIVELTKHYRVFVSLEKGVNDPFYNDFLLKISPEKMHDLEANAKFLVTEGATMASEAFVLGVPYLYLNPLKCGYIDYQCKNYPYRAFQTTDVDESKAVIEKLCKLDVNCDQEKLIVENNTINPTDFLIWFVENYPKSRYVLKENPDFQNIFK